VKIALLGGVFEDPMGAYARSAPENVLRGFLAEAGHEVVPMSAGRLVSLGAPADVYHANHFGVGAYHLALAGARPFVFTSHNPFLVSDCESSESRVEHALQRKTLERADRIVALSSREAELLSQRFEEPRARFAVIPNGLDLALYGPGNKAGEELLTVGQLTEYKGHGYLLEALARLPGVRLRIVTHQPGLRPELERRAAELGVVERIVVEGPLSTPELVERYRACAVYVQPSLAECFPVTVLEAMACGKPVVATDVGGVAEEVGDAGLVVSARSAEVLAGAIRRLLAEPDERRVLGERALARARELYDGRRIARLHTELYAELAELRRQPGAASRAGARLALAAYARRGAVGRLVPESVRRRSVSTVPSPSRSL
jgi:glycosyltransferase involved in cell wall biosynthesis